MGASASCECYKKNKAMCKYCRVKYCKKCNKCKAYDNYHKDHETIKCPTCNKQGIKYYQKHNCECVKCKKPLSQHIRFSQYHPICFECNHSININKSIAIYKTKYCKHVTSEKCYECLANYCMMREREFHNKINEAIFTNRTDFYSPPIGLTYGANVIAIY